MATRLYKPSSGGAAASPAFDASWEQTSNADRVALATSPSSSSFVSKTESETSASSSHDVLIRQYVSAPLSGSGTLTGTVKGQVLAQASQNGNDMRAQILIRIVSNDGATVRGTALAHTTDDPGATPPYFATATRNRKIPKDGDVSLTSTAWQDGDRIVVEEGYRSHNTLTASRSGTLRYGDNAGTDLPENETSTTDENTWIEFSQTLTFQSPPTTIDATVGTLTLGGTSAAVGAGAAVGASVGDTDLTSTSAAVGVGYAVAATVGNLALGGDDATVAASATVAATAGNESLNGASASVGVGYAVAAAAGDLALGGTTAGVAAGVGITATVGDTALGSTAATVSAGVGVATSVGDTALGGTAASIGAGASAAATVGDSGLNVTAATVSAGIGVAPTVGDAFLAGNTAAVAGAVGISAIAGDTALAGGTATVDVPGAGDVTVNATVGDLALGSTSASVSAGVSVAADVGNAALSGAVATVGAGALVLTTAGDLSLEQRVAAISAGATILASAGDVALGGGTATVTDTSAPVFGPVLVLAAPDLVDVLHARDEPAFAGSGLALVMAPETRALRAGAGPGIFKARSG